MIRLCVTVCVYIGGNRNEQEEQEKMVAAHMVAIERAQMRARQERK